jgi:polyisoprenoid-binding protein YceI
MTCRAAWAAGLALALAAAPAARAQAPEPDSVVFALSPASRLEVRTGRAGLLGSMGHEHLVRAQAFHGAIVYYPQTLERSRVALTVVTDSLEILTDAKPSDLTKMRKAMREQTLRVAQFPEITFVSRAVEAIEGGGGLRVTGDFTMVAQSRSMTVDVALKIASDTLRATARFPLKQRDFGIKPYGTALGTVKVRDEVWFEIDVVAIAVR